MSSVTVTETEKFGSSLSLLTLQNMQTVKKTWAGMMEIVQMEEMAVQMMKWRRNHRGMVENSRVEVCGLRSEIRMKKP